MKGCDCPALRYASDGDSNTSEPSALSYLNRIAQTVRPYLLIEISQFCNIFVILLFFCGGFVGGFSGFCCLVLFDFVVFEFVDAGCDELVVP